MKRTALGIATVVATLAFANGSAFAAIPVKLIFKGYFGHQVNVGEVAKKGGPTLEDVCFIETSSCQAAGESSAPGGYKVVTSVAGAANGNVYVADELNHRVQELTSQGQFVLMFGKQVNQTETAAKAGAALEDVCTAASKDICKAGVESIAAGEFSQPVSVAVDAEGDVYVAERKITELGAGVSTVGERVQKFMAEGNFLLELGKEVNATTKLNLCTREEEEKALAECVGPKQRVRGGIYEWGNEVGAFNFVESEAEVLGAGGPENLLYVGDENRIQEFKPNGEPAGETQLQPSGASVHALAVAPESGDSYVVYGESEVVARHSSKGTIVGSPIAVSAGAGAKARLRGLAIDPSGHLAVAAERVFSSGLVVLEPFGNLYEAASGKLLTTFKVPGNGVTAVGFNGAGQMYGSAILAFPEHSENEIFVYSPVNVAEVVTLDAKCSPGKELESDVTENCELTGDVNPESVSNTVVWFEWGLTEVLGEITPKEKVESAETVHATVVSRPNSALYYRLAAEDNNVKAPEELHSEELSTVTPLVAPHIVGPPTASFVKASSAVLSDEINPENASTEYFFEYSVSASALSGCPGVRVNPSACLGVVATTAGESKAYGRVAAILEASGLQSGTTYNYRLSAASHNASETAAAHGEGPLVGSFTTSRTPEPRAQTGGSAAVTATSAIVSGTVEPDGVPVSYAFELGIYKGDATQYGVVFSGLAGSSTAEEHLALTGLQPGTTYAYRIAVSSGYIANAAHTISGTPGRFTTAGVPEVLKPGPPQLMLSPPPIKFPSASSTPVSQKLEKALKACRRNHNKKRRVGCERAARKKYGRK
jgi:hypothetical protein